MTRAGPITVLIVDDSALVRHALRTIFQEDAAFAVVGEADTGRAAQRLALQLRPQLITMDLDMPDGDGLEAIAQIMARAPTRILVVTGLPRFRGADATFAALARGALDLVPKMTAWPGTTAERHDILRLARRLAEVPVLPHVNALRDERQGARAQATPAQAPASGPTASLIAIGASVGGPRTLAAILAELPAGFPLPIVVVQHLSPTFAELFVEWLAGQTRLRVLEAAPGVRPEPGTVYLGLRGPHLVLSPQGTLATSPEAARQAHCPAVDVLFESVARTCGPRALGVLLTGMGRDGAIGLLAIRQAGGTTLAEDEGSCVVYGMPRAAVELGAVQHLQSLAELTRTLATVRAAGPPPRGGGG